MEIDNDDPQRLNLGELVTWGDGYATGVIVGCYLFEMTHVNAFAQNNTIVDAFGKEPASTPGAAGYIILVNGHNGGHGMYKYRAFDTEHSIQLNRGHRDVRPAVEIKR